MPDYLADLPPEYRSLLNGSIHNVLFSEDEHEVTEALMDCGHVLGCILIGMFKDRSAIH